MLATIQSRTFLPSHLLSTNITIRIYETLILPVVLYGCETWSLDIKGRLRVFENRMLRTLFGPMSDGVIGGFRKVHNEELHNLYFSPTIMTMTKSRRMKVRTCSMHQGKEECI
jgi:hypothetical protein